MQFNENTPLRDILSAYPWLPKELVKMDSKFSIINSPIGKMLIHTATLKDVSKMAGYPVETVLEELNKLIDAHEGKA